MITDDNYTPETQREAVGQETAHRNFAVGFLKGNTLSPAKDIVITPNCVKKLIDNEIPVFIERKLGKGADYIDLDYADVGATLEEEAANVCRHAQIIVRLSPFAPEELKELKEEQIVITPFPLEKTDAAIIAAITDRRLTAISLNLIRNVDGDEFLQDIIHTQEGPRVASAALGNTILSLIFPLVFNDSLRYALQSNPLLINSIYSYKGIITHPAIAARGGVKHTDLLEIL